jgi:hypothetical protein
VSAAIESERDWLLYLSGGNLRTDKPEIGASWALSDSMTTVRVLFEKRLILDSFLVLTPEFCVAWFNLRRVC